MPVVGSTALSTNASVPGTSRSAPAGRTRTCRPSARPRSAPRWRSGIENAANTGFTCSIVTSGSGAFAETRLPACTSSRPVRPAAGARIVQ